MARIIRAFALLFVFVTFCSLGAAPARASFGDCNSSTYLAQFDARFGATPGFLCVESDRLSVSSDAGVTHIRIAQHLVADWATTPSSMRAIKDGVAAAVAAFPRLGRFRIPDVTILLVDGFSPPTGEDVEQYGDIAAWTDFRSHDECRITLWLLGPGARDIYASSVIAHELFHCVELGSLSDGQLATGSGGSAGGGNWWIEASAEWFSTLALPAARYLPERVAMFDHEAPTTAINAMSYEAFPFFAWLGHAHGPNAVLPFLRQMATSPAASAQRAAMITVLPADEWLHFAEAYMDQAIVDGQGASINSAPTEGATLEWDDTVTRRVNLEPFTITARNLSFHCGRWTIAPRPARSYGAKPFEGDWGPLPGDLDNRNHDRGNFKFVGFNASNEAIPLQIVGTVTARCESCAGIQEVDECLIGEWELTTDGALEFARQHFPRANASVPTHVGNTIRLNADGTFTTGASHVEAEGSTGAVHGQAYLNGQAAGRWSSQHGTVNYCADSASLAGRVTVTSPRGTATAPMTPAVPPAASHSYTCNGNTYVQTTQVGTVGTVRSVYTRLSH